MNVLNAKNDLNMCGPEELKPTKTILVCAGFWFGGCSCSLVLNTNVNVEIQELNVKEALLANPSVVMLLMLNTTNTVGP